MPSKSPLRSPDPPQHTAKTAVASKPEVPKPSGGRSEFVNRAVFSLIMAYTFQALISAGVVLVLPVVLLIKVMMFYEVMRINIKERKENQASAVFRFIPYYFLTVTLVVITLVNVKEQLIETWPFVQTFYHSFGILAFLSYMGGFVLFVLSLRKGMYRYQIGNFAWMAMTLIFIVAQGSVLTTNMLRGMIWFLLPVSCVVHNDIWAYACGKSFGRTPLLRLSPKKTLEGFIGAWIMTTIWAFWFAGFLCTFPQMICPKRNFGEPLVCEAEPLFKLEETQLPAWMTAVSGYSSLDIAPVQYHAVVFAAFASLLAPFGGFFASGLKRAFKLKDFGALIPGHGGMTDRMDCQIIMAMFVFVYLETYIYPRQKCPNAAGIMSCIQKMPIEAQAKIAQDILAALKSGS